MPSLSQNELTLTIKAVDNASAALKKVQGELDETGNSASKASESAARLDGVIGRAVSVLAAAGAAAVGAGAAIGIKFNSSVEQAETKLMAFMKDGGKVAETLAWVKDEAAKTQFSFTEMANAAADLTPVAKQTGEQLESLIKEAEILAALNPSEGLTGATFALREALSGDWTSIIERFNLPRKRINELKDEGVPAMKIISKVMGEMGVDYGLVSAQGKTLSARFDQLKDKLTMMAGAATKPVFDKLSSGLAKLDGINWQNIGNDMAAAVNRGITTIERLVQITWTAMPAIAGFTTAIVAYRGAVLIATAVTTGLAAAQGVLTAVMAANPIGLAVVALTGLTAALATLQWQTGSSTTAQDRLNQAKREAKDATDAAKLAEDGYRGALLSQEGAALAVEAAQKRYNDAVRQFGPSSLEARQANHDLSLAVDNKARADRDAKKAQEERDIAQEESNKKVKAVEEAEFMKRNAIVQTTEKVSLQNREFGGLALTLDRLNGKTFTYTVEQAQRIVNDGVSSPEAKKRAANALAGRASGGPVSANTPYLVGENRDGSINRTTELFIPNTSGYVLNSQNLQNLIRGGGGGSAAAPSAGGGGQTVNNYLTGTFNFNDKASVDEFFNRLDKTQRLARSGMA